MQNLTSSNLSASLLLFEIREIQNYVSSTQHNFVSRSVESHYVLKVVDL